MVCENKAFFLPVLHFHVNSDSDEMFLISYLDELRDSGVGNFWIGASGKTSLYLKFTVHIRGALYNKSQ